MNKQIVNYPALAFVDIETTGSSFELAVALRTSEKAGKAELATNIRRSSRSFKSWL